MQNKCVQLELSCEDVMSAMEENDYKLITLLEKYLDFDALIPVSFHCAYYLHKGRKRINALTSFVKALLLKQILGMKEDTQLLTLLHFSEELRAYCAFEKLPDASQLSRFRQDFCPYIEQLFYQLVELTEPICREMDSKKADYLIFDTTGIEPQVKENNPKFLNTKLNQAKQFAKSHPDFDPYKGVYAFLPEEAEKAPMAKQQYINGHFCYAYKAGIVTDGLGIVRHISFFDESFKEKYPEFVSQKSDNPDKDKEIGDSTALKPVLSDFFQLHPTFSYSTFLGDAAFDSYDNYAMLRDEFHFSRVCVPMNPRNSKSSSACFNQYGNPVCPLDGTQFLFLGKSGGKHRSMRYKWVCHKSVQTGNTRRCTCETPCTNSSYGKCTYTYPDKNFRDTPGIPRNTEHWKNLYRHRTLAERTINLFKNAFGLDNLKTLHPKTIRFDLFLAGCTQLIGVILAKAIHKKTLYKSIRKIAALAA